MWDRPLKTSCAFIICSVHPHACGTDVWILTVTIYTYGSPPRMWDRLIFVHNHFPFSRFTPTHVGQTGFRCHICSMFSVHPHACGTDWRWRFTYSILHGSPPRMWDRLEWIAKQFHIATVHPHACGTDVIKAIFSLNNFGSPPRMWDRRKY